MYRLGTFQQRLSEYLEKFTYLAESYDGTTDHGSELQMILDDYSTFITDKENQRIWENIDRQNFGELEQVGSKLREISARCVALMEKYRALNLLSGHAQITDYFKNIETCIQGEFGSFQVTSNAKVLLVGSGSFPMTPLQMSRRTGAEVVGIDIDEEAIELGRKVMEVLGSGLRIRLENVPLEQLDYTKEATHIIFSSTIAQKYDLLEQLHPLTNEHVVVVMRYGDGLKSLFNYPMRKVSREKWKLAETILCPDHVYDVALYTKA